MIRPRPVKRRALDQQHFFLQQEIEHHFLVVVNIEAFGVNFREHVQRAFWLHAGDARNIVDQLPGAVALFIQTPAGNDEFADTLVAAQRGLDSMLGRHVGAQTHRGQHFQSFDIAFRVFFRAIQHHPALTEAGDAVSFRQSVEGHRQQIRRQSGNRVMLGFVVEDLVVDLIGENNQVVLAGDLHDLLQQLFGVDRAGGVVGVDDHDPAGARRDFGADIVKIRKPVRGFVTQIVHRFTTGKRHRRRPQRVVRSGNQHLIATV